jgi:hypothetical protein
MLIRKKPLSPASGEDLSPTDELTTWGFGTKLRINVLCIIGVAIGVISLLAVWVMVGIPHAKELPTYEIHTGLELAFEMNTYWHIDSSVHVLFMLFAFGTLLGLLTPLGSLLQAAAISYMYLNNPFPNSLPYNFQIGLYVGVLSSIVLFLSFLHPIGLNFQGSHLSFRTRALTVSKYREQTLTPVESKRHIRFPRIMKLIVAHRRMVIALLFSGLLIVPMVFIARDYYSQPYGTLVIMVSTKGANYTGIMIIIDGENMTGAFYGNDEYYHKPNGTILGSWSFSYGVVPGTHVTSFDFGIPSTWPINSTLEPLSPSRFTDGIVDYSKTVNVEPLGRTTVEVMIL